MKVSVIMTVLNEEKNIDDALKSIINQTKKPNEFIIVDGGSNDKTYNILKKNEKKYKWIKVFQKKDSNISQGRNYAISKAKNNIIVGSDAGTKYKKDWLKKLIKGFDGKIGFGQTKPQIQNEFQKILAKKMKQRFGSSRNIIFGKSVWKKIGGYPEDLDIGEDTLFNERIKQRGYKLTQIPGAIGYWEMRENLEEVKKQFLKYGYWDGVAYKKYRMLPLKHKIAVVGIIIISPFYPLLVFFSQFSLSLKIDISRRFSYLEGFLKGITSRNKGKNNKKNKN